jgi:hypothetical protein
MSGGVGPTQEIMGIVRRLTELVSDNREEFAVWGAVAREWLRRTGSNFLNILGIAYDVGRGIGHALDVIVSGAVGALLENVNAVLRGLEAMRGQIDRIPGANLDFTINEIDTDRFFDSASRAWDGLQDSMSSLGGRFGDFEMPWGDWDIEIADATTEARNLRNELNNIDDPDTSGHERRTALLARAVDLGVATVREQVELMALERELLDIMQDQNRAAEDRVQAAQEYRAAMEAVRGMVDLR